MAATDIKITRRQIRVLNEARTILAALEEQAGDVGYERSRAAVERKAYDGGSRDVMACGRVAMAADTAESAIFRVLNIARTYGGVDISEDQMHNRTEEVPA